MKQLILSLFAVAVGGVVFSMMGCQAGGNFTGREYMPDMGHPLAYEANLFDFYHYNTWGTDSAKHAMSMPRQVPFGSIPRGYAAFANGGSLEMLQALKESGNGTINGHVPYYYGSDDAAREQAKLEITKNPFPATKSAVAKGKELYNVNCAICHGEQGNGNGYLWRDGEGPYPNKPANFLEEQFLTSTEGRYYHAIMRGKGVMGAYAEKLSFEERWDVIHYIHSLQNKDYAVVDDAETATKAVKNDDFDMSAAVKLLEEKKIGVGKGFTLNDLKFKTNSAEIDLAASHDLNDLLDFLKKEGKVSIEIAGHTDNVGDGKKNLSLSEARAQAVFDFLLKGGIDKKRLSFKGYGASKPIADNGTNEGKAANRRTDFTITKE